MPTRVCAVSGKESWQDVNGRWYSSGGFPLQMAAIASLFDSMTLLVTRSERPGEGGLPLPANATVIPLRRPTGHNFRRKLSILAHLLYYLKTIAHHEREADVVHVPPPGDIPLLGMLVGLLLRKRTIIRYCGSWHVTALTTATNRVTRALMRAFAGGRNVMLATGAGTAPPARHMHWVYATAISKNDTTSVRANLNRGLSNPPLLVYVGRLHPIKGLVNLVEALSMLRKNGRAPTPASLEILGDGPQKAELFELARSLDCGDLISFKGQLSHPEVLQHLLRADVCVLPSLSESFCKARLDAFLCGVPVVTTEVGFGRLIVGEQHERGWIVPIGDSRALAEQLDRVLTDQISWLELRHRCRSYVEQRTLENWTLDIAQICAQQWNVALVDGKLDL